MTDSLLVLVGLAGLVLGGDLLVRGGATLSHVLRLSPAVVGIVVLGFGTSMPELLTSLTAALQGRGEVAIGNVAGSNIANILLILGITALILPVISERKIVRRDGGALILFSLALVVGIVLTGFPRLYGLGLLAGFSVYMWLVLKKGDLDGEEDLPTARGGVLGGLGFVAIGLVFVLLGARWLVGGAVGIAESLGASEAFIALTLVAVGTSLPELSASVAAALKGKGDMAFGNVIGSNIFNAAAILGLTVTVEPLARPSGIGWTDAAVLLAAAVLALRFGAPGHKIARGEGAVLLAGYILDVAIAARTGLA